MPQMPKRACWADMVEESGDEMMADSEGIRKRENDEEKMQEGEVSPAASFCSTQFSFDDEPTCCQNTPPPLQCLGAQYSMPPAEWTQTAMVPAIFGPIPMIPVACTNLPSLPMEESYNVEGLAAGPLVKQRWTDPVKKRFSKQGSQGSNDGKRRPLTVKNSTMDLSSRTLPEASEEDWQRRLSKRHNIVASVKETPEYRAFAAQRGGSGSRRAALRTPSPDDRSVSKRQWEEKVQKWRNALRNFACN